jgi:hypothetical protein
MESRITKKVEQYVEKMKESIVEKMKESSKEEVCAFILEYEKMTWQKVDFDKRKKLPTLLPVGTRCCANRSTGEQCTRRKKSNSEYCGTHTKQNEKTNPEEKKDTTTTSIWSQDIQGIMSYIDEMGNIYKPEDVMSKREVIRVIGTYKKEDNHYSFM